MKNIIITILRNKSINLIFYCLCYLKGIKKAYQSCNTRKENDNDAYDGFIYRAIESHYFLNKLYLYIFFMKYDTLRVFLHYITTSTSITETKCS